jgi:hypothetical protein
MMAMVWRAILCARPPRKANIGLWFLGIAMTMTHRYILAQAKDATARMTTATDKQTKKGHKAVSLTSLIMMRMGGV